MEMRIDTQFQDTRHFLIEFHKNGLAYILLYDADYPSLFIGQKEDDINLDTFWKRHQEDKDYCLSCELMLRFDKKRVLAPDYPPLELGLSLKVAKELLKDLSKSVDFARVVKGEYEL